MKLFSSLFISFTCLTAFFVIAGNTFGNDDPMALQVVSSEEPAQVALHARALATAPAGGRFLDAIGAEK